MRIVSGKHKGKKIDYISDSTTRPTKDAVRESIFNILAHAPWCEVDIKGSTILDVFAGTGSLGLEALSRGATKGYFIEQDKAAINVCRKNIESMDMQNIAKILNFNATKLPPRPENIEVADLVFLDPPYSKNLGEEAIVSLIKGNWVSNNTIYVLEEAKNSTINIPNNFEIIEERSYGITKIIFIKNI